MTAPLDLDAIRARVERATEGPWAAWLDQDGQPHMQGRLMVGNTAAVIPDGEAWIEGVDVNAIAECLTPEDREFIAHAREDVPALLDEVERLRADRDKQGRFLSTVDEFARVSAMSHDAVLEAVGVRADLDRAEATIARVQKALTNHPHCDRHAGDDPITCGWKRAVLDVQAAIEGTDS